MILQLELIQLEDLFGIILIDGRHPDISMVECLPPETEDENSFITNVRTSLSYFDQPKKAPEKKPEAKKK